MIHMYTEFFGLNRKPFEMTPDPQFLFLTETHKEGLAHLKYGVLSDKGFVLLTGEVGTGKTTLLHSLINEIGEDVKIVFLANPVMTPPEFRTYLGRKLGIQGGTDKADFLIRTERTLFQFSRDGTKVVLIVDEAQKLSQELLEEIRLLSNIESPKRKLISILLVGQPEVLEILSRDESRALRQRIGLRYHIKPLTQEETDDYVRHRLVVAGAHGNGIFDRKALKMIHSYSRGFPRVVNILCDHALLTAYAKGKKQVVGDYIRECASELDYSDDIGQATLNFSMAKNGGRNSRRSDMLFFSISMVLVVVIMTLILYRSQVPWVHDIVDSAKGLF